MSEKRSGIENKGEIFESKYTFCNKNKKLSEEEKHIFDKTILTTKPQFLKIYAKKLDGDESSIILVKDRFGKRRVIARINTKTNL